MGRDLRSILFHLISLPLWSRNIRLPSGLMDPSFTYTSRKISFVNLDFVEPL